MNPLGYGVQCTGMYPFKKPRSLARPDVSNDPFLLQARRAHGTLQTEARNYG